MFQISSKSQTILKAFVSRNILYESYKTSITVKHYFVHFYVLISTLRPNYLNFSNPYNFENRITKSLTFKTAFHLEEHNLNGDL